MQQRIINLIKSALPIAIDTLIVLALFYFLS
jgi:hypothetical protein